MRHDCGTALNEATTIMGYWVWSTQRTCHFNFMKYNHEIYFRSNCLGWLHVTGLSSWWISSNDPILSSVWVPHMVANKIYQTVQNLTYTILPHILPEMDGNKPSPSRSLFFSARGAAPFHLHPFSRQAAKACAELFPPGFLTCGGCQLPMNATSTHGIPMGYCNSRKHGLVNHDSSTPSLGWAIGIYESTFGGHDILPCCHKLRCMISTRNCQHFSVCWLHLNIRTIKQKHFFSII